MMTSAWTRMARGGRAREGYEFSRKENKVLARTATLATGWGVLSVFTGIIAIITALVGFHGLETLGPLLLGTVQIIVGASFVGAGGSLRAVVETEGSDIPNMMSALRKMGTAFLIQISATLIALIGGVIASIIMA